MSETELENAINWYFSLDNLDVANDRVLQLMDRLELPNLLRCRQGRPHTASDGQKFEVRGDSLNANHSFKYFGKEQGVSVYTFRDELELLHIEDTKALFQRHLPIFLWDITSPGWNQHRLHALKVVQPQAHGPGASRFQPFGAILTLWSSEPDRHHRRASR